MFVNFYWKEYNSTASSHRGIGKRTHLCDNCWNLLELIRNVHAESVQHQTVNALPVFTPETGFGAYPVKKEITYDQNTLPHYR